MDCEVENQTKNSDHQLQSNYDVWPWWSNWFAWLESPLGVWAQLDDVMGAILVLFTFVVSSSVSMRTKLCCNNFLLLAALTWSLPKKLYRAIEEHFSSSYWLEPSSNDSTNFFNGRRRFIHMNGRLLSESCKDSNIFFLSSWHGDTKTRVMVLVLFKPGLCKRNEPKNLFSGNGNRDWVTLLLRKGKTHDTVDLGWFTRPSLDRRKEQCGKLSNTTLMLWFGEQ